MEKYSYFIQNKALFGSYPTQNVVTELERKGVRWFIDLVNHDEQKMDVYKTEYNYINYPISDRNIPDDKLSFAKFIVKICTIIKDSKDDEIVYIHCRGGHGRSGLVVACILCYLYKYDPLTALRITTTCHSHRQDMKQKYRHYGSPKEVRQKNFVVEFFSCIRYDINTPFKEFCNKSLYSINIPKLGAFPNAYLALQSYKNPENKEFIFNLQQGIYNSKLINRVNNDWQEKKSSYMLEILRYKFNQHDSLKTLLLSTLLRPLVRESKDYYWGCGKNNRGRNMHGVLLNLVREELFIAA
jgi:protein tyrosine/serine phosphatase